MSKLFTIYQVDGDDEISIRAGIVSVIQDDTDGSGWTEVEKSMENENVSTPCKENIETSTNQYSV